MAVATAAHAAPDRGPAIVADVPVVPALCAPGLRGSEPLGVGPLGSLDGKHAQERLPRPACAIAAPILSPSLSTDLDEMARRSTDFHHLAHALMRGHFHRP